MALSSEVLDILAGQKKTWNNFAPGWGKWDDFFMRTIAPMGDALLAAVDLKPNDQVLDVATGTGEPGLSAAKRVPHGAVMGIDIAEKMVHIARQNATSQGILNYTAETMEASSLPYPDHTFSTIICRLGIMFFGDLQTTLSELLRVLKPGGSAAFSAWAGPASNPWASMIGGIVSRIFNLAPLPEDAPGFYRFSNPEKLRAALANAGFRKVELKETTGEIRFDSPARYWDFMTEVVAPIVKALEGSSSEKRKEVRDAVVKEANNRVTGAGLVFPWKAWVAVAAN